MPSSPDAYPWRGRKPANANYHRNSLLGVLRGRLGAHAVVVVALRLREGRRRVVADRDLCVCVARPTALVEDRSTPAEESLRGSSRAPGPAAARPWRRRRSRARASSGAGAHGRTRAGRAPGSGAASAARPRAPRATRSTPPAGARGAAPCAPPARGSDGDLPDFLTKVSVGLGSC